MVAWPGHSSRKSWATCISSNSCPTVDGSANGALRGAGRAHRPGGRQLRAARQHCPTTPEWSSTPSTSWCMSAHRPVDDWQDFNQTTPGQLIALDARTLASEVDVPRHAGIDAMPALSGTQLCFGDRHGISTSLIHAPPWPAAQEAADRSMDVGCRSLRPRLIACPHRSLPMGDQCGRLGPRSHMRRPCPTVSSWALLQSRWHTSIALRLVVLQREATTCGQYLHWSAAGRANSITFRNCSVREWHDCGLRSSLVNPGPNDLNTFTQFPLPSGNIFTGFTYDDGTRVAMASPVSASAPFGCGLATAWQPVGADNHEASRWRACILTTPYAEHSGGQRTPVLYKDPQGGLTVLFGVFDPTARCRPAVWLRPRQWEPRQSVPTGVTYVTWLSPSVTNGVV